MKFTVDGDVYEWDGRQWNGPDQGVADAATSAVNPAPLAYYPTPWHEAKVAADAVGGEMLNQEPDLQESYDPEVVY